MTAPIRMIATDLDGTLVHTDGTVSAANRAALIAARRAGIYVAVCTGRRHSYAMRVLHQDVLHPGEVIISSNGAVTRTVAGDLFWQSTLSADLVRRICGCLDAYRDALVLTFDRSAPNGSDAPGALAIEQLDTLHGSIRRWMELNAASLQRFTRIEDALEGTPPEEPIQAMLCGGMTSIRAAESLLQQHFAAEVESFRTEYPGKDLCILDIVPRGISKGTTLRRLADRFGIGMDQVLALGDNWNDVPMLEIAGHSAVLRNAPPDLLSHAAAKGWHIGPPGDRDGFAGVLSDLADWTSLASLGNPEMLACVPTHG